MITVNENILNMLNAPARRIDARVELYNCSTLQNDGYNRELLATYHSGDALIDFTIDRMGDDGKFFGFGICQKLIVKLRDSERLINIHKGQVLEVSFGIEGDFTYPCPLFKVEEVSRDENTNNLTVTAFDFLYKANEHRVAELALDSYTIRSFIQACGNSLNLPIKIEPTDEIFNLSYPTGANFKGDETLREALNAVAEATQTIYFVDWDWKLTFRRLEKDAEPVFHIDKSKYFTLTNKTDKKLTAICHATELGDNVEVNTGEEGATQFVRNNPFWDLRDDIGTLLQESIDRVGNMVLSQYSLKWRGNYAVEIGDAITIATKNNDVLKAFLVNDTITYNGGMSAEMEWHFTEHNAETADSPVNISDAIRQTYARVNKAEGIIELAVKETQELADGVDQRIAAITLTTDAITSEVERIESKFDNSVTTLNSTINQTAEEINSEVSRVEQKVDNSVTTLGSQINQNATSITSTVKRVESVEGDIEGIEGDITTMESQIQQTAEAIELKVSKGEIISAINMSTESIDISADKLNLTGYITASDLQGNGTTTINGSNITTGTISADRINMTGAIDWSDLSTSCKNTVASYAGQDGADADLPSYIKSTYIDSTTIKSPIIQGGTLYAGSTYEGYCRMTSSGLNVVNQTGSNVCGIGWYPGYYNLPYVVLGAGVDEYGTDQALIKKYTHGVWIGDSDSLYSSNAQEPTSGTGIFIDFWDDKIYKYIDGTKTEIPGAADYVIENGSNSIWSWRKWNSGRAECWCKRSVTTTITTAWGSMYTSGELTATDVNFPFTFAETPMIQTSVYNNGAGVFIMAAGNFNPPSTTATGSFELVRGTQSTASNSYGINYYVFGRYK